MSSIVFTIKYDQTSNTVLGSRTQFCAAGYSIGSTPSITTNGGYNYATYTGFGFSNISADCPSEAWPANTWKLIMRIKLSTQPNKCTDFQVVNDSWTTSHNIGYYISLNGLDKTGTIESVAGTSSPCSGDCSLFTQLQVTTDGAGAQTTWEIRPVGSSTPVCSGGPYGNNTTTSPTCCLAAGCYTLRVLDSFGDGMCCTNGNGGYILKDGKGNRIIDNNADGTFTTLSKAPGNWCLPLSTNGLVAGSCDQNLVRTAVIQAIPNSAVSAQWGVGNQSDDGYTFWFFDPDGSFDRKLFRSHAKANNAAPAGPERATYQKLSGVKNPSLPQNLLLNVRIRSRVNGTYSAYGPACRLFILPGLRDGEDDESDDLEEVEAPTMNMFPNPLNEGLLTVELTGLAVTDDVAQLEVYDLQGKRMLTNTLAVIGGASSANVRLIDHTGPGVYLVVVSSNTQRFVERLIVQ
ncbi:MAG: T9SS type A sorting domain-containing protein [Flavobacteriales bacterium]